MSRRIWQIYSVVRSARGTLTREEYESVFQLGTRIGFTPDMFNLWGFADEIRVAVKNVAQGAK